MPVAEESRFFPAAPDETYRGLVQAARELAELKAVDDFARSVVFAIRVTARTPGADVLAYVVPGDGGCHVRMAETAGPGSHLAAESDRLTTLLDRTGELIGYLHDRRAPARWAWTRSD